MFFHEAIVFFTSKVIFQKLFQYITIYKIKLQLYSIHYSYKQITIMNKLLATRFKTSSSVCSDWSSVTCFNEEAWSVWTNFKLNRGRLRNVQVTGRFEVRRIIRVSAGCGRTRPTTSLFLRMYPTSVTVTFRVKDPRGLDELGTC